MSEKKELKEKDRGLNKNLLLLSSLREGEEGTVHSMSGKRGMTNRLAAMGLSPGTKIKVLRNSWGPVIVLASNTRVAIGKGQACKILIERDQKTSAEEK
jgi:Fe2+ transport system protein FeoA